MADELEPAGVSLGDLLAAVATATRPAGGPRYWSATLRHSGMSEGVERRWYDADGPCYREHAQPATKDHPFESGFDGALAWEKSTSWDGWYDACHPRTRAELNRRPPPWVDGAGAQLVGVASLRGRRCYVVAREERDVADRPVPVRFFVDVETHLPAEIRRGHRDDEIERFEAGRVVAGRWVPTEVVRIDPRGTIRTVTEALAPLDAPPTFGHPDLDRPAHLADPPADPNLAALSTVWTAIRYGYFDETFAGLDWDAIGARYRERTRDLPPAGDAWIDLANEMLQPLGASHLRVLPPRHVPAALAGRRPGSVGLGLRVVEGQIAVARTRRGSPAEAAGVRPGSVLERIGGLDEAAWTAARPPRSASRNPDTLRVIAAGQHLVAPEGDPLALSLRDGSGEVREVVLTAGPSVPPREQTEFSAAREGDVLTVSFRRFYGDIVDRMAAALRQDPPPRALVLDLRGNGGGIGGLIRGIVGPLFAEPWRMGTVHYRRAQEPMGGPGLGLFDGPVAVLVDCASASSAELAASHLQESGRARLFGRPTAGLAIPSLALTLMNGAVLHYPDGDYTTTGGRRLEGNGVQPDELLPLTLADLRAGIDRDHDAALRWLGALLA